MNHLKIEVSEQASTKPPSLTQKIVQTKEHKFFTLRNLCLGSLETHVITIEVQKLLKHVVLGQPTEVEAMLLNNSELLLERGTTKDYSGRIIMGTAFQVALGAGDQPMWEMMLPFFENLESGEALRQFQEQFPNGIEDEEPAEALKDYYNAIVMAIIQDVEHHGVVAIETFRQEITSQKVITQGKHFNLQHLIAAYRAFVDNFEVLGGPLNDWKKRDLFWKQVIGYVQRQMTTYDAQIHCSGVQKVLNKNDSFGRTVNIEDRAFFSLEAFCGLGFEFAVYSYYGARAVFTGSELAGDWFATVVRGEGCVCLKNYVKQKQTRLLDLESHLSKRCAISPLIDFDNPNFASYSA